MTSVVVWRERELIDGEALRAEWDDHPAIAPANPWMHVGDIWLAADTRISAGTPSGTRTVSTDAALKILPITLELYQEREDGGPGTIIVYTGELAYAWAGSMLPATATYAMVSSYLKRLTGPAFTELPTMDALADLVNRIGTKYAADTRQPFEAFLVGTSPQSNGQGEDAAYRLRFDRTGFPRSIEKLDLEPSGSFALLGSRQQEISATIEQGLRDDVEYVPALAVKDVITADADAAMVGDIGGYLNLARVSRGAVEIYPEWRNPKAGLPRAYSDDEVGQVGEWRVTGILER